MIERDGHRLRHELKYNLNSMQYELLRAKLRTVLRRDPHAGPDGQYHIRSLYFDDFKNTALFEKQAGISRRKKYRIRIYDLEDDVIKLDRIPIDFTIFKNDSACPASFRSCKIILQHLLANRFFEPAPM